ncbi:MAG TPA: hypothetical protein VGM82_13115 [Gemmatimonadaceae bacterium]|jgi:hypothetical protein
MLSGSTLRVGVLATGADARARHDGALLGIEEAKHAAELFGGSAELVPVDSPARVPTSLAAIIADSSVATLRSLAADWANGSLIILNVACSADELRGGSCSPYMFHVAPSDAMLRDARGQVPDATDVVAWDGSLIRFGADTLNDRFRARFGRSMNPTSWAAWFAVKALWESSLRMKSADPRQLADYLTRDTTQFDGHKGRPLSFRPWDHQLRQFVYARVAGKLTDVPQSASPLTTSHEFLDKLGTSAATSSCHFRQ